MLFFDLKSCFPTYDTLLPDMKEGYHEFRTNRLFPINGLSSNLRISAILRFLCHSPHDQFKSRTPILARTGQVHGGSMRSDCRSRKLLGQEELPGDGETEAHSISGCRQRQAPRFYNKQFYLSGRDYCGTVSMLPAGRIVLQTDQAAFAHQNLCASMPRSIKQN